MPFFQSGITSGLGLCIRLYRYASQLVRRYLSCSCICPVHALERYLAKSSFCSGPLYKQKNGKFLTCQEISRAIKKAVRKNGINPKQYLSHSFHIGTASTAAAADTTESMIKSLECWQSECHQKYIRINKQKLCEVPKKLVRIQNISKTWSLLLQKRRSIWTST